MGKGNTKRDQFLGSLLLHQPVVLAEKLEEEERTKNVWSNKSHLRMQRAYPWRTAAEWGAVRDLLFGGGVEEGLQFLAVWETRAPLPQAVSATFELLSARDRLGLACAVIRLVNGLTDPLQSAKARNLRGIAVDELGLPGLLVDVRHESTHGVLPQLATLERCKKEALDWLWRNYWRGKQKDAQGAVSKLRAGEKAPWQELSKKVIVDEKTLKRLVALRKGRDDEERPAQDEEQEEDALKMAALPPVPRWGGSEGPAEQAAPQKRARVQSVAADIAF